MKISKTARFLSVVLALAMILCSLPFAVGVIASAEGATVDYSTLADNLKPHITYFRNTLGMHDATGLRVKDGAVIPDGDWWWQLNVVDKSIENSPAFAIYDVTPNTEFVVKFSATTDTSAMKFYASENMIDWYLLGTVGNEKTVTANLPYYANYLKIVWPLGANVNNGIISVNYTAPTVDANNIVVDYEAVKPSELTGLGNGNDDPNVLNNRGVWQSNNYQFTASGIITPHYNNLNNATTANSFDCYATYKVQPNTYFNLSTTVSRSDIDQVSAKLGYYFGMQIYVSPDNVNFTKLDVTPFETAGYGNHQGNHDARRRVDYSFIVPEGMAYVKCVSPLTQNLKTLMVDGSPVWGYIGNDFIDINKVEFTRFKYDYVKLGTNDYYIESAFSTDTMADFGITGYGGGFNLQSCGFDTTWDAQRNNGVATTWGKWAVEPGTPFYAGFFTNYPTNLNNYLSYSESGKFVFKFQGYDKATSSWVDVSELVIDSTNSTNQFYGGGISAEQNIYDEIRILWPGRAADNDSATGDDAIVLREVAFTAPQTKVYDYTKCTDIATLTTDFGALDYTTGEGNTVPLVSATSGNVRYLFVSGSTLNLYGHEGAFKKAYFTYKVDACSTFKVCFNKNDWYDDVEKWNDEDFTIKAYSSATDTFETVTEHAITYSDSSNNFEIEFDVPFGEEYIKVEFPQTCKVSSNKTGNDMFRVTGVEIGKANIGLDGISIDTEPTTVSFYKYDDIIIDGLVVGLDYTNGEYRRIDYGFETLGYNNYELGEQEVYVDFEDYITSYKINIYVNAGDLNCDKKVNMVDLIRLKKIAVEEAETDGASADIDGSGVVDSGDLAKFRKYLIGVGTL